MGTKWEQKLQNLMPQSMGTKWEQELPKLNKIGSQKNGIKVGTSCPKWDKNGNKVGTRTPKWDENKVGTRTLAVCKVENKNFREQSGNKVGTRTPKWD